MDHRIIATVCKHIVSNKPLPCGNQCVRVDEPADLWIIVSALEVVQPRFLVVDIKIIGE